MKTGLLGHKDKFWGNKAEMVFSINGLIGLIPRLDAYKEAFDADGKCMFPFPLWNDSLVLLWE